MGARSCAHSTEERGLACKSEGYHMMRGTSLGRRSHTSQERMGKETEVIRDCDCFRGGGGGGQDGNFPFLDCPWDLAHSMY